MSLPHSFELAVALRRVPDVFREPNQGIMERIRIACAMGWADPIYGGKRALVALAVLAGFQSCEGRGKGTNAQRRLARIERAYEDAQDTLADELSQEPTP